MSQEQTKPDEAPTASVRLKITPPNMKRAAFSIVGTAPLVQCAFGRKAAEAMAADQAKGSQQKKKDRKKPPKDFMGAYREALHVSTEKWHGHPAAAFRIAMVSACRLTGIAMTLAKLSVFIDGDGIDAASGMPLVRIHGEPRYFEAPVRLKKSNTLDIRARPMFEKWRMDLTVRYDADMFTVDDIANLLLRVGLQVGIGEGRADSKDSCGTGWGFFEFAETQEAKESA